MGLIREPESVDFVVEPHEFTEKDRIAVRAFIAAYKDREKEEQRQINKKKHSFKQLVAAL